MTIKNHNDCVLKKVLITFGSFDFRKTKLTVQQPQLTSSIQRTISHTRFLLAEEFCCSVSYTTETKEESIRKY